MKRGQASTLTWFGAFIVIFFILIMYTLFSSLIGAKKIFSQKDLSENSGLQNDFVLLNEILNKPIVYDDKSLLLGDLISRSFFESVGNSVLSSDLISFLKVSLPATLCKEYHIYFGYGLFSFNGKEIIYRWDANRDRPGNIILSFNLAHLKLGEVPASKQIVLVSSGVCHG